MLVRSVISGFIIVGLMACGKPADEAPNEPTLRVDRNAVDFGREFGTAVWIGTTPQESLLVENLGLQPLVIESVDQAGDSAFKYELPEKREIEPLGHTFVRVTFTPTEAKEYTGSLTIVSNAANEPQKTVQLSGKGVKPE
ncbi:MAG: hypothetical protein WBV82_01070 [Myxococcaceae bacterium]